MTKQLYDEWVEGTDGGSLSRSLSKRHSAHEQEVTFVAVFDWVELCIGRY